ncbi:hypothetical protein GCM10010967_57500 [Dyadobacter beijingensis]|uniref:Bestrophin, RFP-TM, chloride channel n=1 Tax=Dyadobacter beijingensis TaxID=365489 RepID=A0ABQ2IMM2_9BACT|nr:bestrophin family ion channel [Dyadobacter beijingensis]GGN13826.1 hypothetical protein GCM10010967_57500 [Dyadobacter beijingensis]
MIIRKTLSVRSILEFTGHHLLWLTGWMSAITCVFYFMDWKEVAVPWVSIPLVGTAVAFYVGFKNNQAYDRLWEARKIWSEITNDCRKLAALIKHCRSGEPNVKPEKKIRRRLLFYNIAYLYQLREQLLEPTIWEHVGTSNLAAIRNHNRKRREKLTESYKKELGDVTDRKYLSPAEELYLSKFSNKAIQLLTMQVHLIQLLFKRRDISSVQQLAIQGIVCNFLDAQGRLERIKQTPFPRKQATFSFIFVCIFVALLPFGTIGEFAKFGGFGIWLSIPVNIVIGWIYVTMELIADYSENPFEGLHNDTPMLAICRQTEIEMLQIFGEDNVPEPFHYKGGVLL